MPVDGADIDALGAEEAEIVVGCDGGFAFGRYRQRAAAAEYQLPLAEEGGFLVFRVGLVRVVSGCVYGAVFQRTVALEHHEGALVALVVDGRAAAVCKAEVLEHQGLLDGAVDLDGTVAGTA